MAPCFCRYLFSQIKFKYRVKVPYSSCRHHVLCGILKDTAFWKGVLFCMTYSSLSLDPDLADLPSFLFSVHAVGYSTVEKD